MLLSPHPVIAGNYSFFSSSCYRMRFLLQVVSAVRTNNSRKIPQYDPSLLEHKKKLLRGLLPGLLLSNRFHGYL